MSRDGLLRSSPIFLVAGFIGFLFLSMVWNFVIEPFYPKLRIRSADPSLAGIAKAEMIPISVEALWSGQTQRTLSNNFGRLLPPFAFAVRARNQFLYSLFGVAGSGGLLIGKDEELFEGSYVSEFCTRGAPPDQKRIEAWANDIRDIQDRVEAAGKVFIYLVTPSKAAQYSEYLPATFNCPARAKGTTEKLAPFRAALDARHIRYVDAASLIQKAKPNYPIDLFPRGGTHWNMLGAALATQTIVQKLDEARRDLSLGAVEFNYSVASEAKLFDRDLLDLLNLLWPDPHYPAPVVEIAPSAKCARPPHVVEMGGSFLHEINILWEHAGCAPSVDHWFYFRRADSFGTWRFEIPAADTSVGLGRQISDDLSQMPEAVRRADIVLLEENESNISTMKQVWDMRNAAAALK
jgi:hypothetical protein